MSRACSIDITLHERLSQPRLVYSQLQEGGWRLTLHPQERILYIPYGIDDYDWNDRSEDEISEVMQEIDRKVTDSQRIGLVLHIEDTSCQVCIRHPYSCIEFNIYNSGRKRISSETILTDYTWYIKRITPYLVDDEHHISEIVCRDLA